jgi:hypothetical protein
LANRSAIIMPLDHRKMESADAIVGRRAQQAALELWAAIEAEKDRVGADLLRATP